MASGNAGAGERTVVPRIGRRRRRLYWTVGLLLAASVAGSVTAVTAYRASRAATYRSGEDHREITRRLELKIPGEAPAPHLVDVTAEAGLDGFRSFSGNRSSQLPEDMGPGAAWGDFDNDGDDDLFLVSAGGPLGAAVEDLERSRLYVNRGDGTFVEALGFPEIRVHGMGAAWGDADGDGRLDLLLTGYDTLRLYRNTGKTFVRDERLEERPGFWAGASWADFDRDGDLDLYVCGYVQYDAAKAAGKAASYQYGHVVPITLNPAAFEPASNLLLRNDGDRGFRDVAVELGVDNPGGRSLGALWLDLDEDGRLDLYVANDISDNALFRNLGDRFEDAAYEAWVADYRGAMGLAAGDWDRDGDDDLFVTHWIAQENALYESLLRNLKEGKLRFTDVADRFGLGQIALQRVGWGTEFLDVDADGWLDLAVANGSTFESEEAPKRLRPQAGFLFWNREGRSFHDLAALDPALEEPHVSRGLAVSDYDGDGDVDLLIVDLDGGVRLFENRIPQGHRLQIDLRATAHPLAVEGTRVTVTAGGIDHRRTVASASYLSQSTRTLHFGLGDAERVDRIVVQWPDGTVEVHGGGDADVRIEIVRGEPTPTAAVPADERGRVTEFWRRQREAMNALKVDGDCPRALGAFRAALEIDPAHEDSLYYLAICLAETGDVPGALDTLDRLRSANPASHRAFRGWGLLQATHADSADGLIAARGSLEQALAINPEETGALHGLAEVSLLLGDRETARRQLELELRANPAAGPALYLLGYLDWASGNGVDARERLTRAAGLRGGTRPPEGAASAEGDVRRRMHRDPTPLGEFFDAWNGNTEPDHAFRDLDERLTGGAPPRNHPAVRAGLEPGAPA